MTAPSHEYLYNSTSLLDIRLRGTPSYVYTEILNLFDSCMDDQRFGIPYDYSKNWYANLSDVEILARMIYGENTYRNRDNDRKGIAWVAANRYLSGRYTANFKSICTQRNAFESITGGTKNTNNSRNPSTTSHAWGDAVTAACCVIVCFRYGRNSEQYLQSVMCRPSGINNQLYFVSLEYFRTNCKDGNNCLKYSFGTSAGYVDIKDVSVIDVASDIRTKSEVLSINPYYEYNIFFNEKNA